MTSGGLSAVPLRLIILLSVSYQQAAEPLVEQSAPRLTGLVLSDIHFRKHERIPTDVDQELRNGLLEAVPKMIGHLGEIDVILVCGDVAFQARENEYGAARAFLVQVQAATGGARIYVVPGNHDIQWPEARGADQRHLRSGPRQRRLTDDQRDNMMVRLLEDPASGPEIFKALDSYNKFADPFGCAVSVGAPCWTSLIQLSEKFAVEIRGLTSPLVSDKDDEDDLVLSDIQLADLTRKPGVINITMCHHPFSCLLDGVRQRPKITNRSALHVTGHEHKHSVHVDPDTGSIHLCAGALQPTRDPAWDPRLYAFRLDIVESDPPKAAIRLVSMRWDRDSDGFVQDEEGEYPVKLDKPPLTLKQPPTDPASELVRLKERLSALPPSDRLTAARAVGADLRSLTEGGSHQLPSNLLADAQANHRLGALWAEVERLHGRQENDPNPFEDKR